MAFRKIPAINTFLLQDRVESVETELSQNGPKLIASYDDSDFSDYASPFFDIELRELPNILNNIRIVAHGLFDSANVANPTIVLSLRNQDYNNFQFNSALKFSNGGGLFGNISSFNLVNGISNYSQSDTAFKNSFEIDILDISDRTKWTTFTGSYHYYNGTGADNFVPITSTFFRGTENMNISSTNTPKESPDELRMISFSSNAANFRLKPGGSIKIYTY
jgi:hypothetical protein